MDPRIELEMVLSLDEERWRSSGTCNVEFGTGELSAGDARPPRVPEDRMDIAEAARRCCLDIWRAVRLL